MNLPESTSYEQPPAGTHAAVCYAFIDLGTQANEYQGEHKMQHQVFIRWELSEETMADGKPFTIGQFYTWSMSDKAKLRAHLEAWRNKPFEKSDFGPGGFDTKNLLGKPCSLIVSLNERGNARVTGVGPKMKGVEPKPLSNEEIYLSLTPDRFDPFALNKLSDKLQETIKRSPEYAAVTRRQGGSTGHNPALPADFEDEIPF